MVNEEFNNPPWFKDKDPLKISIKEFTPKKANEKPELHRLSGSVASIYSNASSQFERFMRSWVVDVDAKTGEYVTV